MAEFIRKVFERLGLYTTRVYNLILLALGRYPRVLDSMESVNRVIEGELSVARFGDGELMIICGGGWGFQKYDSRLAERLAEVLKSSDPGIAICIPDVFRDRSRFTKTAWNFWYYHILSNLHNWNRYTLRRKVYLDTQFTRFYMDLQDKVKFPTDILARLKQIWEGKDLLIVEGAGSRLGYKNDLFDNTRSIRRILCPPENAFSSYDKILETSSDNAGGKLVLIALGMTATVLAYDLAKRGFRALDIGHIDIEYEWYRMKAEKKVPVQHRYMNEVSCRDFDDVDDKTFLEQIITTIE